MMIVQEALLQKAHRALASAKRLLEHGDLDGATNRAYYACFYLAQAALVGVGEEPKTHAGTHTRFRYHFAAGGIISLEIASILTDTFAARQRLDYDALAVTDPRAASDIVADAERFVAAVRNVVAAPPGPR